MCKALQAIVIIWRNTLIHGKPCDSQQDKKQPGIFLFMQWLTIMSINTKKYFDRSLVGLTLNYRDAERTSRCIISLLAEGVSHILIWDNSEDDEISATNLKQRFSAESRVSIAISPKNLGFAAGVNQGLAWIRAHFPYAWVLLINNDAVLQAGSLSLLTTALAQTSDAVIAYPTLHHRNEIVTTLFYHRSLALVTHKHLPGSLPYASGCCQLLAPERLVGPWFDEDFFMYGEDVELGNRLGAHRMVHVPGALVVHEGSASSGMASPFYETHVVAAHWLLARKLAKNPLELGLFFLGRALSLPARALLRALRQRSLIPLTALWRGWRLAFPRCR